MRAVALATGERLVDKRPVEQGINHPVDRMLHDHVGECRRMDNPLFRLVDDKLIVRLGPVYARHDGLMQGHYPRAKVALELEAGPLIPFSPPGVLIGGQQVVDAEYPAEKVAVSLHGYKIQTDLRPEPTKKPGDNISP